VQISDEIVLQSERYFLPVTKVENIFFFKHEIISET